MGCWLKIGIDRSIKHSTVRPAREMGDVLLAGWGSVPSRFAIHFRFASLLAGLGDCDLGTGANIIPKSGGCLSVCLSVTVASNRPIPTLRELFSNPSWIKWVEGRGRGLRSHAEMNFFFTLSRFVLYKMVDGCAQM